MKLSLSISPCPNDTFMFDALVNGRIDTRGLEFDLSFNDIEELNGALRAGRPDVSKSSYAVVPQIADAYAVLDSGSALGRGNGPLLVASRGDIDLMEALRVAIPGEHTTANLLMERLYPHITDKRPCLFSDIMDVVARGECDAGVLIHEGRFVYGLRGLSLLADLGVEWERRSGLPLPLGAIVASRRLPQSVRDDVESLIRRSIEYAFANPAASLPFVRAHAREMDEEVIASHIALFVNEYSLSLGATGRAAVDALLGE